MSDVNTNKFGGALLFILGEFAVAEEGMIEDGGMEVFGEDDQGREGSCEVSINELAQAAADEIKHLKEQLAKANEDYQALFSAFESCQDELKKANERVEGLESGIKQTIPIVDTLYALARNQLWIAYVWNDHNFPLNPEKYAKEAAESIGITNVDEANKLVEAFKQLRKEKE